MAVGADLVMTGQCAGGGSLFLGRPEEMTLKKDRGAADELTAVFPAAAPWENLWRLEARLGGELFFEGIVDELVYSTRTMSARVVARSRAALLLDNEAMPQTIRNPSLALLESRFLKPLGFAVAQGDLSPKGGELAVKRGTSVFSLLSGFCRDFLSCSPVVRGTGEVICLPEYEGKRFACSREEIQWVEVRHENYRVLSQAVLPDSAAGGYSAVFRNPNGEGVPRVKYLEQSSEIEFSPRRRVGILLASLTKAEPGDRIVLPWDAGRIESVRLSRGPGGDASQIQFLSEGDCHVDF